MRIIRKPNFGALIDAALERCSEPHFYKLAFDPSGRKYYRAVYHDLEEYTFALEHQERVLSVIECDNASNMLGRFAFPIEPCFDPALTDELRRAAISTICSELRRLAVEHGLARIAVRATGTKNLGGMLLGYLLRHGAVPALELRAVVGLSVPQAVLMADLRKGHRQQSRWGNANLSWSCVDSADPDYRRFESYREFHAEIAGRVTRNTQSWATMYESICAGRGDLVLGYYDGKLVSGTLVLDGGDTAYYASGVYRREMFDKPLGHAAVFLAILRAKQRGCYVFDLGEFPGAAASEKERAIGYFKQGFTTQTAASVVLTLAMTKTAASTDGATLGRSAGA